MKKYYWVLIAVGLLGILGISGIYLFRRNQSLQKQETVEAKGIKDFAAARGEKFLRQKQSASLIAVYEKMLQKYPDNQEIKQKLAQAYREVGQPEKAELLLKEK